MARSDPTSVPKTMRSAYEAVVRLTDEFCRERLDEEYAELARAMAAALSRKRPSPLASGQARTWACAILYELGRVNFLSDRASQPYMTMAELRAGFGVGQGTASAKARVIEVRRHGVVPNLTFGRRGCRGSSPSRTRSPGPRAASGAGRPAGR